MIRVLDTTAFSAAMRMEPGLLSLLKSGRPGEFAVVPPVVAEIEYGIHRTKPGRRRTLLETQRDRFLRMLRLLPWNDESSSRFGAIKSGLESSGEMIDDFDVAIAAIAMAHGASVITANLVHFRRIPDLSCSDWPADPPG